MTTLFFLVATGLCAPQAIDFNTLEWEALDSSQGIAVSRANIPDMDILGVRGVANVELHISKIWSLFRDVSLQTEWIDRLKETKQISSPKESSVRYYSQYHSPWPISNRDFVFHRDIEIDEAKKTIRVVVHSVDDDRAPETDCCVRGWLSRAYWRFTALPNGQTKIEVEVITDPKGMIPTWIINLVQKSWPVKSISKLLERASQKDIQGATEFASW